MKFQELYEGVTPKLPGAFGGVQVMTPQQFVAKSAAGEEPEPKEVDEGWKDAAAAGALALGMLGGAHGQTDQVASQPTSYIQAVNQKFTPGVERIDHGVLGYKGKEYKFSRNKPTSEEGERIVVPGGMVGIRGLGPYEVLLSPDGNYYMMRKVSVNESVAEATKLAAPTRPIGDKELSDYLDRIRGTPDVDPKTGKVRVDKKGIEKYISGKKKTDKYKLPYIHRSSVVGYYNEEGKKYNVDAIKDALKERPTKLLKQNEKMKHSNGALEQFFNIGFAALVGIALDENTNELIIVNTCPGAGSCKIDCFAMKGGKVQFQGPWLSDGRILTYLLNDPDEFFNQLDSEIKKEEKKGDKGGYSVSIRWHDAGDFFSPEYAKMAFKLADSNPDVTFYAYTKVADVVLQDKPGNFMINWSEGAHPSQEKKIKATDPRVIKTKNSRIVPNDIFYDLLVKDEKKNLVKGEQGQWQVIPDKLPELKQRLAKEYGLSVNSILSYDQWDRKTDGGKKKVPLKYNVIITPGEPDITAKSDSVTSTLLLKH